MTSTSLYSILERIDGRGYRSYKDIRGSYQFTEGPIFRLSIDYVQGDPFAAPSRLRVRIPHSEARFPKSLWQHSSRRTGLENALARNFSQKARALTPGTGSGKSGEISMCRPGQEVLVRSSLHIQDDVIEARFTVGLPARGRSVLGRAAANLLCQTIPKLIEETLIYREEDFSEYERAAATNEDADALRDQLHQLDLVAFVKNGSLLPRRSGVDQRPLDTNSTPFTSPPELAVEVTLPNSGTIVGMGIPKGITLIVGGGFHGKSTLLNALERGVYNHCPGDGREFVVTEISAVKIRAEDGRCITGVDISPFINNLPGQRDTTYFSTTNGSGSTSQAANIMEALEVGSRTLLIDEDIAATNFMIRDQRMQQLVSKDKEPITPFIHKVESLYQDHGVSSILVIGGSGDYFSVADHVIMMDHFLPKEVTAAAEEIAGIQDTAGDTTFGNLRARHPDPKSFSPRRGKREVSIKTRDMVQIAYGTEDIYLHAVAQLIDPCQTKAIAQAIHHLVATGFQNNLSLKRAIDELFKKIDTERIEILDEQTPHGEWVMFRPYELAAAINRLRSLKLVDLGIDIQ